MNITKTAINNIITFFFFKRDMDSFRYSLISLLFMGSGFFKCDHTMIPIGIATNGMINGKNHPAIARAPPNIGKIAVPILRIPMLYPKAVIRSFSS